MEVPSIKRKFGTDMPKKPVYRQSSGMLSSKVPRNDTGQTDHHARAPGTPTVQDALMEAATPIDIEANRKRAREEKRLEPSKKPYGEVRSRIEITINDSDEEMKENRKRNMTIQSLNRLHQVVCNMEYESDNNVDCLKNRRWAVDLNSHELSSSHGRNKALQEILAIKPDLAMMSPAKASEEEQEFMHFICSLHAISDRFCLCECDRGCQQSLNVFKGKMNKQGVKVFHKQKEVKTPMITNSWRVAENIKTPLQGISTVRAFTQGIAQEHRDAWHGDYLLCRVINDSELCQQAQKSNSECHENEWACDHTNGMPLDPAAVNKVRIDEIRYCEKRKVAIKVPLGGCWTKTGKNRLV